MCLNINRTELLHGFTKPRLYATDMHENENTHTHTLPDDLILYYIYIYMKKCAIYGQSQSCAFYWRSFVYKYIVHICNFRSILETMYGTKVRTIYI